MRAPAVPPFRISPPSIFSININVLPFTISQAERPLPCDGKGRFRKPAPFFGGLQGLKKKRARNDFFVRIRALEPFSVTN